MQRDQSIFTMGPIWEVLSVLSAHLSWICSKSKRQKILRRNIAFLWLSIFFLGSEWSQWQMNALTLQTVGTSPPLPQLRTPKGRTLWFYGSLEKQKEIRSYLWIYFKKTIPVCKSKLWDVMERIWLWCQPWASTKIIWSWAGYQISRSPSFLMCSMGRLQEIN